MKLSPTLLTLIVLLSSVSCDDETVQSRAYPYVITKPVSVLADGAAFTADILDLGNATIKKFGFIITDTEYPDKKTFILVGSAPPTLGEYATTLRAGLQKDHIYNVRAYAETENLVVFGNLETFTSQGSLPPKIVSFSPHEGPVGTVVEIQGENIGPMRSGLEVTFGNTDAVIDTIIDERIFVKVPNVLENGNVTVTLEVAGVSVTSNTPFDVWFPWTRKADFPGSYLRLISSFEAHGKIYVLGGLSINPWEIKNEFWVYDPEFDTWTQKQPFPGTMRIEAVAFSCNGKGYYGLGRTEDEYLEDFWEFDPATNTWAQKKTFPGTTTQHARAFTVQGKGYVATLLYSYNGSNQYQGQFWEYDPMNDEWTRKQDFPIGRQYGFSLGTSDKGYLGMGTRGWSLGDINAYDPTSDSWTAVSNYPGSGHNNVGSFFIDGKIYMGLGSNNSSDSFADFWEFDVSEQTWKQMQSCPTKLAPFISHTIGGKGYIGYGWYDLSWNDYSRGRAFYEFNPAKN